MVLPNAVVYVLHFDEWLATPSLVNQTLFLRSLSIGDTLTKGIVSMTRLSDPADRRL